jgi:transposase
MVYKVPEAYLDEYAERILELFHIKITRGQLSRFLASQGLTHKKVLFSTIVINFSFKKKLGNVTLS